MKFLLFEWKKNINEDKIFWGLRKKFQSSFVLEPGASRHAENCLPAEKLHNIMNRSSLVPHKRKNIRSYP
jgi:hypothetical protein